MSPLIYLLTKRIKNGIYRSFKNPVRAFMTILIVGYLLTYLIMIFHNPGLSQNLKAGSIQIDSQSTLATLTFAHLLILLYIISPPKKMYRIFTESDIANLYPVPLKRWRVFRFFLFSRTYLSIFFFMGIMALNLSLAIRTFLPGIVTDVQAQTQFLEMIFYAILIVVALAGLMFWRLVLDIRSSFSLIPKYTFVVLMSSYFALIALCVCFHSYQAASSGFDLNTGLNTAANTQPLSLALAPFGLFADLLLGRFNILSFSNFFSFMFWITLCASGYIVLRSHSSMLYEYASVLTDFRAQMKERTRNPAAMARDQMGDKKKFLRLPWFIRMLRVKRSGAIFWRDMIITWRSSGQFMKGFHSFLLLVVVGSWLYTFLFHRLVEDNIILFGSAMMMFTIGFPLVLVAVVGFSKTLQMVDVLKPLPFSAKKVVSIHIFTWMAVIYAMTFLPFITASVLFSHLWYKILYILLLGWSFAPTFISAFFLVTLHNPDQEDPIQRIYVLFFGVLLSFLASVPAIIIMVVELLLHLNKVLFLLLIIAANFVSFRILHNLSAKKYVNFVFTD